MICKELRKGDRCPAVAVWQSALTQGHFMRDGNSWVDDLFQDGTEAGTMAFQEYAQGRGLGYVKVDGVAGELTFNAAEALLGVKISSLPDSFWPPNTKKGHDDSGTTDSDRGDKEMPPTVSEALADKFAVNNEATIAESTGNPHADGTCTGLTCLGPPVSDAPADMRPQLAADRKEAAADPDFGGIGGA